MNHIFMMKRTASELDNIIVDIEFLLISVIQGVALATLAANAVGPISNLQIEYWLYISSAFVLILIFWSQAIIHVLSFIDWPFELTHNFLYFLTSFIEVMAFSHMTKPLIWFMFMFVFVLSSGILYLADLIFIKSRKVKFEKIPSGKVLYSNILKEQKFSLAVFVPLGLLFNLTAFFLILIFPKYFLEQKFHIFLAILQTLLGIAILIKSIRSFRQRSDLIKRYKLSS